MVCATSARASPRARPDARAAARSRSGRRCTARPSRRRSRRTGRRRAARGSPRGRRPARRANAASSARSGPGSPELRVADAVDRRQQAVQRVGVEAVDAHGISSSGPARVGVERRAAPRPRQRRVSDATGSSAKQARYERAEAASSARCSSVDVDRDHAGDALGDGDHLVDRHGLAEARARRSRTPRAARASIAGSTERRIGVVGHLDGGAQPERARRGSSRRHERHQRVAVAVRSASWQVADGVARRRDRRAELAGDGEEHAARRAGSESRARAPWRCRRRRGRSPRSRASTPPGPA